MAAENFKVKKGLEVGTGITANSDGIDVTGIVTATQFQGDGSGLTGVVGSGSGVVVKDEGSAVGTAGTINFVGTGVSAAISEGTATVTVNAGGLDNVSDDTNPQLGGNLDLNSKDITGSGDIDITGNLDISGISTFGSNTRITANGSIGIGTDIPSAPLHISGADANAARLIIEDNNNGFAPSDIRVQNGGRDLRIASPVDIFFQKLTSGTPILYLENGNAVGIATNSPSATLDVFGNARLRNDVDIDGNLTVTGANITGIATFTGGVAKLLFDGNQKLITTVNGIEVPDLNVTGVGTVGRLDTNGVTLGTNNNTFAAKFIDDAVANFGTDNDLKISHDDTHARITNTKGDIVVSGIISATSDVKVGSAITMDPTSGIITATSFSGSGAGLTSIPSAQLSGALPALDGSALTGVTASGSGVVVKHDGSTVGTAGTINFSTNLDVSAISAGIVTVTASSGGATDKIEEGNSKVEVVDTGTGSITFEVDGNEKLNIGGMWSQFNNNLTCMQTVQVGGQLQLADAMVHSSNTGTRIRFPENDNITLRVNNNDIMVVREPGVNVTGILTATTFSGSGASLTSLDAGNLGVGTIPNGRFPATLPAASGANLTSLTAGNISGTLATGQIADNAVTFAKMQDVGTGVFIGRNDSGSGDIETLSAAEARTLLNVADGATAGITTASSNIQATWDVIHNSASAYRFTGPGQDGAENNPDIYLVRGHKYRFSLSSTSGSHPLQIRTTGGTTYTDGVTYSDTGNNRTTAGNDLDISVQHDAPAALKYHCTAHGAMVGNIYIVGQHLANGADNRVVTATSAYGMTGESGLTYNGSYLGVTGNIAVSTANRVYFGNSDVAWVKGEHGSSGYLELGVNTGHVRILRNGRVGIGTEDPHTQLTVAANSAQAIVTLKRTNSNGGAGSYGAINFAALDGHSVANMYALGAGDDNGAHLIFKTTSAAASNDTYNAATEERIRITSGGDTELRNTAATITNTYSQYLKFRTTQTNGQSAVTGQIAGQGKSSWGGELVFSTKPANGSPNDTLTERVRISSTGNVGIATDMSGGGGEYGRLSVVIPSQSGGAALQVMNSALGSGDGSLSNIVLRSVNNLGTQWADAEFRAQEYIFKNQATEALRITADGYVTKSKHPAFNVKGTNMSRTNSDNFIVEFDNDSSSGCFDNGNNFNTSTHKFVAPVSGYYHFAANVRLDGWDSGYIRMAILSTSYHSGLSYWTYPSTGHIIKGRSANGNRPYETFATSTTMYLPATHEAYVYMTVQNETSFTVYLGESSFSGHLIG